MATEDTYSNLDPKKKEEAVMKELLPFAIYALIPVAITLTIAFLFGPEL